MPVTVRVVEAVNAAGRPVRAEDAQAALRGDVEHKTVGWALWSAEREGQIKRVSPGLYAATTYDDLDDLPRQLDELAKE